MTSSHHGLLRNLATLLLCGGCIVGSASVGRAGDDHASPEEVVSKVRQAAGLLAADGAAGLEVIRNPNSEFTWKDTYIFVVNCDVDEVMANSRFPERVGGDIKKHTDYNGYQYGLELCDIAQRPGGGWVEYVWLRPGGDEPLRKISFVMSVDGEPYQLGAGIYDDTVTIDELRALTNTTQ